jgi:DNA-binding NtrC family response regulator
MHDQDNTAAVSELHLTTDLLGTAPSVRRAAEVARSAARSDDTILIVAESGFSPERIARAIHDAGSRASQPFIAIDCGDSHLPVMQRLFGVEKSSRSEYETASADSALAQARAGTIFLAGIGDMPAAVQVRLSRLLRDGEMRVRKSTGPVRFRLMASTTPGLEADVREHRFRPELYRRLQRLRVDVPPLRDRAGDVPVLIDAMLSEICLTRETTCRLAPAARTALSALQWAGNLDELRRSLSRLVDRCDDGLIRQEDVLADLQQPQTRPRATPRALANLREARQTFEREYISTVLEEYGWRMTEAARVLGIERANLYRKTRQLGITRLKPSRAS